MLKPKPLYLLFLYLSIPAAFAQFTDVINSNRPGMSMSAFSVGKTIFQVETGATYSKETNDGLIKYTGETWDADLTLRYGVFFEQLELIANLDYQNENLSSGNPIFNFHDSGLKRSTFGMKYLVYDPDRDYERKPNLYSWKANHQFNWRQFVPAIALYGGVNLYFQNDKFRRPFMPKDNNFSFKGIIITQNQFGRYTFLTNIIVDKFPSQTNSLDYVLTLTRGFNARVSGFLEIQGYNNQYYKDHLFRTGAAYLLWQNLQIDASFGSNFQPSPNLVFGGLGIAWRFDDNYSEVMLRVPKEDKRSKLDKKSDKIKDKKKEKEKKRVDAIEKEMTK